MTFFLDSRAHDLDIEDPVIVHRAEFAPYWLPVDDPVSGDGTMRGIPVTWDVVADLDESAALHSPREETQIGGVGPARVDIETNAQSGPFGDIHEVTHRVDNRARHCLGSRLDDQQRSGVGGIVGQACHGLCKMRRGVFPVQAAAGSGEQVDGGRPDGVGHVDGALHRGTLFRPRVSIVEREGTGMTDCADLDARGKHQRDCPGIVFVEELPVRDTEPRNTRLLAERNICGKGAVQIVDSVQGHTFAYHACCGVEFAV